jgi:type IV pilus assembly protein PilE
MRNSRLSAGFTLIELMIVVVIIAILTAVALPSFLEQIQKGARAQAKAVMMDMAQKEERFFTSNGVYCDSLTTCPWLTNPPDLTKHAVTVAIGAGTYTITATPTSGHPDSKCGILTLDSTNVKTSSGSAGNSYCW